MKPTQHLAIGAALILTGCAGAPRSPSAPPPLSPEWSASIARLTDEVDECEALARRTDRALADALHLIDPDATGRKKPSELMAEAQATKVDVWIELAPDEAPAPTVKDALLAEGRKLPNPSRTPEDAARLRAFARRSEALQAPLGPLRSQIIALGAALSVDGPATCAMPLETASRSLAQAEGRGEAPPAAYVALYRQLLDATRRNEANAASAIALLATYAAGFAGRDPMAIDRLAAAVQARLPIAMREDAAATQTTAAHIASGGARATGDGSPSGHLFEGIRALKARDFASALGEAAKVAPPGPLQDALDAAAIR
jgi:hypothetical protein